MDVEDSQGLVAEELQGVNIEDFEDDDNEEHLTPAEVLRIVTVAFLNESACPKLLPHKFLYAELLVDQIENMERNIIQEQDKTKIKVTAHRMELYRISYIVNSYFRIRLRKIENCPTEYLEEHYERIQQRKDELLDVKEVQYTESFHTSRATLFEDSFIKMIPVGLQALPVARQLNCLRQSRVFIKVLSSNVEDVAVPDMTDPDAEVIISLNKGSQHLLPLQSVEEHLEKGKICLL